jgi:16S rRNA (cytosine967-C5)-methyltransferase
MASLEKLSTAARLAAAARVVAAVSENGESLDDALDRCEAGVETSSMAAIQALAYGTVRWYPRIDFWASQLLEAGTKPKPQVRALLAVGVHQLAFSSHPPHAIVDQAVEAARELGQPRAAGLINAVLRRFLREQQALNAATDKVPAARFAHPSWWVELIRRDWPDEWAQVLEANNQPPPMWLRVNRRKTSRSAYVDALREASIAAEISEYASDAVLLQTALPVNALPGFERGVVSVQDAGAQLAADLLEVRDRMRVLDACAAPGGKTCHLLERADLDVVAIDRSAARLAQLEQNLRRLGLSASVIEGDAADTARWWDGQPFERVLLDAPCTASGVIRRHPDVKLRRRPADIESLQREQLRLLRTLWPVLATAGRLLYVTCSILRAENEEVIRLFREAEPAARLVPISASFGPPGKRVMAGAGVQILPGAAGMDGFYYACLEKRRTETHAGNPSA